MLNTWKNRSLLAMAIPVIVLLILFNYIPMFGLVVAFKDFNYTDGIFGSPWVGLKNFKFLFSMKDLTWRIIRRFRKWKATSSMSITSAARGGI